MAGYSDTKKMIIDTLMGRPEGTQIQPEDHQAFALQITEYIRSVELVAGNATPIGFADADTVPVEPYNGQAVYLSYVPRNTTKNFVKFTNQSGNSISVTSSLEEVKLVTLLWNGSYWSSQIVTINVLSDDSNVNASNIGASDYILFSVSSNYSIGDIVRYDGKLYKFTSAHAAGNWLGTDVELASINSILTDKLTKLESETNTNIIELNKNLGGFSQKETDEDGFYICNENGEVIIRFDILDTKSEIGDNLKEKIIKIARKSITPDCVEDGFYICNENGEAIAQYKNNTWELLGLEVKDVKINPCYSSLGLESGVVYADSLSNSELVLMDYPQYLKRNATVSFGAKISTFSQIKVGVKGGYFCQAQIDSTNISIIHNTGTIKTEAHGLNISGWIDVALKVEELNVEISVHSLDGYKKITATLPYRELYGRPTIEADENTTLTDISLRGYCDDFQKSIWFVGDSYTSCTEVRWTGQMLDFGITNWMLLGLAGGKSKDLYEDLLLALKYGTPAYLVWCMGMNDADSGSLNADYKKYFELVKSKCDGLGIIMIPATVPCVKTSSHPTYARDNSYKNAFIKSSGLRYIDLAKAVGGDTFTEDAWYEGYLETTSPWIHTSELGAKAQAAQIIRDFPEILRNK